MLKMNRLKRSFEFVRKIFFARWDKGQKWTIKMVSGLRYRGECNNRSKSILIRPSFGNEDELHQLLIHEICHAVTASRHGKRWQDRMLKTSKRADEIGRKKLAERIRQDVGNHFLFSPRFICEEIEDAVIDGPNISFGKLINSIARENGMYRNEFESIFRRNMKQFERVFRETKKFYG